MANYRTKSTSPYSAVLVDPIIIDETGTTRKVLFVDLNDKKKALGETVGITIVHQRKNGKAEWENVKNIPLSSLKGGDGVKLDLDSKTTRNIYEELTRLYALIDQEGVKYGTQSFTVAKADEIIKVPKSRKTLIERLLADNHADEVWQELVSADPDLATRLSLARVQTNRAHALAVFKQNLEKENANESFWQNSLRRTIGYLVTD